MSSSSQVQRDPSAEPHVQWNHVDGPLLVCRCGTLHWLTKQERLWLKMGFTTVEQLNDTYTTEPQRG